MSIVKAEYYFFNVQHKEISERLSKQVFWFLIMTIQFYKCWPILVFDKFLTLLNFTFCLIKNTLSAYGSIQSISLWQTVLYCYLTKQILEHFFCLSHLLEMIILPEDLKTLEILEPMLEEVVLSLAFLWKTRTNEKKTCTIVSVINRSSLCQYLSAYNMQKNLQSFVAEQECSKEHLCHLLKLTCFIC